MSQETRAGRIRAVRALIVQGARRFAPARHVPRLLPDGEDFPLTPGDRATLVLRLRAALRSERRRGRAGHWSYDLNRHLGLLQALRALSDRT
jgi:hypothetical protein